MKRLLVLVFLGACTPDAPPPPSDPVVVYVAFEDDSHLAAIFDRYKQETGVLVIPRRGPAGRIIGDIIDNDVSPPADLLLTSSVVQAWRAAEENALRPLFSDPLRERIPGWARDADDMWFGTESRHAVIAHNEPDLDMNSVEDLAALAEERFAGALCLTSSTLPLNRAIIATMIGQLGVRPTELIVRGWVQNLATPPFDSEERVLDALRAGTCGVAIVSSDAANEPGVDVTVPATRYADVATLGVARHARNPDGAAALAEWLISEVKEMQIEGDRIASQGSVGLVALHYEDAVKLAERARYP
jgi:iron(III) transport system substrate-binding protein